MYFIYHICTKKAWQCAQEKGFYLGNNRDQKDGFIHMSTAQQVQKTALKYYLHEKDLLLLKMNTAVLEPNLKWEGNSCGEIFPHFYNPLSLKDVETALPFSPQTFPYETL